MNTKNNRKLLDKTICVKVTPETINKLNELPGRQGVHVRKALELYSNSYDYITFLELIEQLEILIVNLERWKKKGHPLRKKWRQKETDQLFYYKQALDLLHNSPYWDEMYDEEDDE